MMQAGSDRHEQREHRRCFSGSAPMAIPESLPAAPRLSAETAQALANLLPMLGCGEEAAAVAFHHLAGSAGFAPQTAAALRMIGDEEDVHDALLTRLGLALPPPEQPERVRRAAKRFHIALTRGGPMLHLARIAAVDAGVCTILSRLTDKRGPIAIDAPTLRLLRKIRCDEAKHVAVARCAISNEADRKPLREAAATAREALARLLALDRAAFEALGVDPDQLIRDIARLPNGLI